MIWVLWIAGVIIVILVVGIDSVLYHINEFINSLWSKDD